MFHELTRLNKNEYHTQQPKTQTPINPTQPTPTLTDLSPSRHQPSTLARSASRSVGDSRRVLPFHLRWGVVVVDCCCMARVFGCHHTPPRSQPHPSNHTRQKNKNLPHEPRPLQQHVGGAPEERDHLPPALPLPVRGPADDEVERAAHDGGGGIFACAVLDGLVLGWGLRGGGVD